MLFLKKKSDATISAENLAHLHKSHADFIPYFGHYNSNTILTKNGELLQTIKITENRLGLNFESGDSEQSSVRGIIRKAVHDNIKTDHFSLWIHTIRKRKPIRFESSYANPFAAYVHENWRKKNCWQYQYYNEVYVTILREGQSAELLNGKHLRHAYLNKLNRDFRNRYLDAMYKDLEQVTENILRDIRPHYNAHLLGIVERVPYDVAPSLHQPIFYSEPIEFLGTVLNLTAESYPLPELDISNAINNHAITFGYNAMETKSPEGTRRFGALLTLKQYHEASGETIDQVLQSSTEMIISQSFDFVPHQKALKTFKEQKELFDISGDAYSIKATGLDDILRNHSKRTVDFCEQQTSIMVIVDEYKQLDSETTKVQNAFGELGMNTVREDIMLEEAFWAQLPGNFEFIRRKDIINSDAIAGLSRLNRFPVGTDLGNHWHEALTILPTKVHSPYFFNFHKQDNGHTLLLDFNSFKDQAAQISLNFLLTSTFKYEGRLFVFDRNQSSRLLFDKLNMPYHIMDSSRSLSINPFTLDGSPRNKSFLLAWLTHLVAPAFSITAQQKEIMQTVIDQIFAMADEQRNMAAFIALLSPMDSRLADALTQIANGNKGIRFDTSEALRMTERAQAFNMDALLKNKNSGINIFAYLIHRIIGSLDGSPTVIVINEALDLFENPFFAPRLESLLEMLKQSNVMVISTVTNPGTQTEASTLQTLMSCCATKLIFPDDVNVEYAQLELGLSAQDAHMLEHMERESGDFLLKQDTESIALNINLDDLADIKAIFANDIKTLITAGGKYASLMRN